MKKNCLFVIGCFLAFCVYADDYFLITIENRSGHAVQVDVSNLRHYSSLHAKKVANVEVLKNMESLELSIISKAVSTDKSVFDKIILSDDSSCSELVVEPASLDSELMHIGQNGLSVNQQLRDTGVGYKVTIPARSTPFVNTRNSTTISSWLKNIYSKLSHC